jgi:enoyl-CoA hydratase
MSSDIHIIRLDHGKANAIDQALLDGLVAELDEAASSGKNAVVLTGKDGFFSAGLNLKELPETPEGMADFVERFERGYRKLLEFPLPVVAAVNGHAIAGGCVLACAADVRIGAEGGYKVGVSEVSLGIVFPATAFEIMRHTVEVRHQSEVLLGGRLLSPEQAIDAGILHRVVAPEKLLAEAEAAARELGSKPYRAFRHSKLSLRAPMLERIDASAAECRRSFVETWFSPDVVERRKAMLAK